MPTQPRDFLFAWNTAVEHHESSSRNLRHAMEAFDDAADRETVEAHLVGAATDMGHSLAWIAAAVGAAHRELDE